jgi:hypothetical protein
MFIGHFALGYAAKRATPRVSLAMLFAAAQFADILWPVLVAVGIEQVRIDPGNTAVTPLDFVSYPYSHSLLMLVIWGVVIGVLYRAIAGGRRTFVTICLLVISHWVLDFVTHRPDVPLYPGGPKVGLGLWNSVAATVAVEVAMFAVGVWLYFSGTRARDRIGRWAAISLAALLLILYAANLAGPPPPSVRAIYLSAMAGFVLLLAWSWWSDRHRDSNASNLQQGRIR